MSSTARYLSRAAAAYRNKDGNSLSQILIIDRDSDVTMIASEILPVRLSVLSPEDSIIRAAPPTCMVLFSPPGLCQYTPIGFEDPFWR